MNPSPESSSLSSSARWLRQQLERLAEFCFRRPVLVLSTWAALLALSLIAITHLRVDPDIAELLPPEYESVQDIDTLRERVGGVGYVVALLEGGDVARRRELADALSLELEKLEAVSYVETKRPAAYLKQKALWLLEPSDLGELERRVRARYDYGVQRAMLDFDDEQPPEVRVDDLLQHLKDRFGGLAGSLQETPSSDKKEPAQSSSDYYEAPGRLAIFVRPAELATELDFSKRVVGDVTRAIDAYRDDAPDDGIRIQLTGRYKKRVDLQGVLGKDLRLTGLCALLLVAGYLWLHFRRFSAVILLLIPLLAGLALSYGLAAVSLGVLNILTAFLGAILIGIGIDTGIHLLGRVHEHTRAGHPLEKAVRDAFRDAGRVSVGASATTAVAFACLALTDFRAFREFGLLTAAGVTFVLLAYLTMTPALLRLASGFRFTRSATRSAVLPGTGLLLRFPKTFLLLVGIPTALLASQAYRISFDADLSRMDEADLPSFHLDAEVTEILGRSQTPLVAFADDAEEARLAADELRNRMRRAGNQATISEVVTLPEILPDDIEQKRPVIASIRKMVSRLDDSARDELNAVLPEFNTLVDASPPLRGELPPGIRQVLAPDTNQDYGPLVLLYPSVSLGDAVAMERLASQVRRVELPGGKTVRTAGEPMIVVDILHLLQRDGPRILLTTLLLVFLVLRLTLGSFRLAFLSAIPAAAILLVTAGALVALDMEFNVLNVVILPILLGVGVDDGAHLVARLDEGESLASVWQHTGAAVTGAILTDVFGFGSLALAAHPGLQSLGIVALVGMAANFVVCVILLPLLVAVVPKTLSGTLRELRSA